MNDPAKDPNFIKPDKVDWLEKSGAQELDDDQQALLLALAQLESELGRDLSDAENEAIQALGEQLSGFDSQEIADAVEKVVNAPTDPERVISWSELEKRSE